MRGLPAARFRVIAIVLVMVAAVIGGWAVRTLVGSGFAVAQVWVYICAGFVVAAGVMGWFAHVLGDIVQGFADHREYHEAAGRGEVAMANIERFQHNHRATINHRSLVELTVLVEPRIGTPRQVRHRQLLTPMEGKRLERMRSQPVLLTSQTPSGIRFVRNPGEL